MALDIKPPHYDILHRRVNGMSGLGTPLSVESAQAAASGVIRLIFEDQRVVNLWNLYAKRKPTDPVSIFFLTGKIDSRLIEDSRPATQVFINRGWETRLRGSRSMRAVK